jgi:uncharacterized repeat protein (TIGR03803 family)
MTILYRFTGAADGAYPGFGALLFDQSGNLYGTTRAGGAFGQGTVFKLSPSGGAWNQSTIYNFTGGSDGAMPYSGVVSDVAGNLYGTTFDGGDNDNGTIFELTPLQTSWIFSVLYTFEGGADGSKPWGGLLFDSSGNLMGTTSRGGASGTVFQMTFERGSWSFRTIYSLDSYVIGTLALDETGSLYGTTLEGGAFGEGSLFKLTPSGGDWLYSDLHDFIQTSGSNPVGDMLFSNGNLYGTTEYGGPYHCQEVTCGVAWEFTP